MESLGDSTVLVLVELGLVLVAKTGLCKRALVQLSCAIGVCNTFVALHSMMPTDT